MIGKISKSGSFKALIDYLDKENAVVLGTNMYGQNNRELTAEFMMIRDLNPGIRQPVLHASFSLVPGETLTNEQFTEACETWMEKMGFDLTSNQYRIVRHKDTEHEHTHLVINRIDILSGKVVIDSFDRYRSQEIIRQLEQTYALEPVASSWQTFKKLDQELALTPELSSRKELAHKIEQAAEDKPTMPQFFQRLAEQQIQAKVQFTRNGKPRGITYQEAAEEKVAGNTLGKAYSFPGLQKYLKVNYDPARDNQELVDIFQRSRQQQASQSVREPARQELELQPSQLSLETEKNLSQTEEKTQQVWEPQYGIPAIQDLIKAIPTDLSQPPPGAPNPLNKQREKAQTVYQKWASQAKAIYHVREPKDIDQRIAFLMHKRQHSSEQITQVLAQSPVVQELVKRDVSYAQSYSQFCQSQSAANQAPWQAKLDQYRKSIEAQRQRQEQQRLALERQQRLQQQRQHNLELLGQWQEVAIALGKPATYVERIQAVTADYQRGLPLSEQTKAARQQDIATYQQQLQVQDQHRGFSL